MIVSNSSCLIILDKLGRLAILKKLYGAVTIPKALKEEVFSDKKSPNWLRVVEIRQPAAPPRDQRRNCAVLTPRTIILENQSPSH